MENNKFWTGFITGAAITGVLFYVGTKVLEKALNKSKIESHTDGPKVEPTVQK